MLKTWLFYQVLPLRSTELQKFPYFIPYTYIHDGTEGVLYLQIFFVRYSFYYFLRPLIRALNVLDYIFYFMVNVAPSQWMERALFIMLIMILPYIGYLYK